MKAVAVHRLSVAASVGIIVVSSLVSGCAHTRLQSASENQNYSNKSASSDEVVAKPAIVIENGEILVRGMKLKNSKFDFPITINSRVEYWLDYFTGKGRPHYTRYLERSKYFIPYIKPLLQQAGLPEDLVYLAMIESGFNNHARSTAKAVGPWQFISATGKRYGLMVNWWVDERRDVRKSTLAAIDYLGDLNKMFRNWELAAASYNAGEGKVARAIRRYGSKDFWVLSRHRFFRPETRDYVPKIIAAAIIGKNPGQFGFPVEDLKPAADEAVAGDGEIVKLIKTDKPEERSNTDLAENGPESIEDILDEEEENDTPEPEITPSTLTVLNDSADSAPLARTVPTPHVTKTGEVGGEELAEFEVQSPADLLKVARAAGLSYQTIKALNPELLRWCTPPNVSSYRIKLPVSVKERFLSAYNHEAFPRKVNFLAYKVRRGETLSSIARHFGLKVDPVADLNGVSPRMPLRSGVRVLLPMPNDRSRSLASLEVRDPPEKRRVKRNVKRNKIPLKKREAARSALMRLKRS